MTMPELLDKYDDEHLVNMYAVGVLDGDGEDDRRAARICAAHNVTVMNSTRMHGKEVEDRFYHSEDHYLPSHIASEQHKTRQSWDEQRRILGF